MRLYVNKKEIDVLKAALKRFACSEPIGSENTIRAITLFDRVELCEKLQDNVKKASNDILDYPLERQTLVEVVTDESY